MAKNPVDYLAAVQRWAEGGVVLSLQTFFSCHKGISAAASGQKLTYFACQQACSSDENG